MPRRQYHIHFIYKTICLITNKFYMGMHSTFNINDGYLGSGKRLWYSINKYGKQNHKIEIIEFCDNRDELKKREEEIINEQLLQDKNCMNLKIGGEGGWTVEHQRKNAFITNKKIKEIYSLNENWCKKRSKSMSKATSKRHADGEIFGWRKSNNWLGKKHREDTKKKIGLKNSIQQLGKKNSQYGTCWICNLKLKQNKKIKKNEFKYWKKNDWIKGRKMKWSSGGNGDTR